MISLVAKLINIFATALQNILFVASCTGKLIVTIVTWLTTFLLNTIQSILLFFQIVYEDNVSTFTEELPNSANGILNVVIAQLVLVQNIVTDTYFGIILKINAIISSINWLHNAVFVIISEVLIIFFNAVIFIGNTMWLIVTFIPVHLPQLIRVVLKNIGNNIADMIVDGYMRLLKFTNFLTEVPLQSFMGITSAIVIVRLCIHFRETLVLQLNILYWSIVRKVLYLQYVVFNYFTNSEDAILSQMAGRGEVGNALESNQSSLPDDDGADALCVICQERQKCVLTLPCRHICLCTDCCRRLYGYQRTCPICRTFINHSVTVYL